MSYAKVGSADRFRPFHGLALELDRDFLIVAANRHELHGFAGVGVAFLVRREGREEGEVARADLRREFQPIAPADLAAALTT
ncbi:MAG: hypothetical protein IT563_24660 [Alphaproteobacteria bacterium]|nr:hypothetical protein [Alphaproteobacteria bacterium]